MATSSYNRPVIVNSTWGVKNLLEAMEKGNQLNTLTKEDLKEIRKVTNRKLTSEQIERIKDKYSDWKLFVGGLKKDSKYKFP